MAPPSDDGYSIGELARQVRDVFARLEGLARRLEDGQFVRSELYNLYKESVNQALATLERRVNDVESSKVSKTSYEAMDARVKHLEEAKSDKAEVSNLAQEVSELKDDKKWLIRLVIGFIILGVLGAVFAVAGAK